MASTRVFFDTDVLINWLCKEVHPRTKYRLWKAPYEILKKVESGKLSGFTTLVNLMEIVFVLRRKKQWKEEKIANAMSKLQGIANLTILVPTDADIIAGYNLQNVFALDPFDALYYAIFRTSADYLVSRDKTFLQLVNQAEKQARALTPEDFLKKVK